MMPQTRAGRWTAAALVLLSPAAPRVAIAGISSRLVIEPSAIEARRMDAGTNAYVVSLRYVAPLIPSDGPDGSERSIPQLFQAEWLRAWTRAAPRSPRRRWMESGTCVEEA